MSPVFNLSCSCVWIGPHDGPQAFDAGVKVGLEENKHQMSVYLLLSAELCISLETSNGLKHSVCQGTSRKNQNASFSFDAISQKPLELSHFKQFTHFCPVVVLLYSASSQVKSDGSVVDAAQSETLPPGLSMHKGAQGEFGATSTAKMNEFRKRKMEGSTRINGQHILAVLKSGAEQV